MNEILKEIESNNEMQTLVEETLNYLSRESENTLKEDDTVVSVPIKKGEVYTISGCALGQKYKDANAQERYPIRIKLNNGATVAVKHFTGIENAEMGSTVKEIAQWVAYHSVTSTQFECVKAKKASGAYGTDDYKPAEYAFEVV